MIYKPSQRIQAINFIDKHFDNKSNIEIKAYRKKKSISQNAFIWLLCAHIGHETGNSKEDIYRHLIDEYAPLKTIYLDGKEIYVKLTLSDFDKNQAMEFINQIITNFSEYDLPNPDDIKCSQMYEYYKEKGIL